MSSAGKRSGLPPLPAEDYACGGCGFSYAALSAGEARTIIASVPERTRAAALAVPESRRRRRPQPDTWSVLEYACHLRDVYATSAIRLHRVRTEDSPALEPMLNDLRARRFRYNTLDLASVLDELSGTVSGFLDEINRLSGDDWSRSATRLPGESRTALWLVRHAAHEGVHHLGDITSVGQGPGSP
ncbi:MAG: DinB family protein [Streptosporangiales bacterium]|nr:DinB family protein [Streptosporangiales bacterium]